MQQQDTKVKLDRSHSRGADSWLSACLRPGAPKEVREQAIAKAYELIVAAGGDVPKASKLIGLDPASIYRLRDKYPELREAIDQARATVGWTDSRHR